MMRVCLTFIRAFEAVPLNHVVPPALLSRLLPGPLVEMPARRDIDMSQVFFFGFRRLLVLFHLAFLHISCRIDVLSGHSDIRPD